MTEIKESKVFSKQILKTNDQVRTKYMTWAELVRTDGIACTQKDITWKDHELKGDRKGQRSIKLGGKWRGIYIVVNDIVEFILMEEITPHDY